MSLHFLTAVQQFLPKLTPYVLMTLLLTLLISSGGNSQQGQFGNVNQFLVSGASLGPYAIRTGSGAVTGVDVFNNGASNAYLKLYDAATVTCGASAPAPRRAILSLPLPLPTARVRSRKRLLLTATSPELLLASLLASLITMPASLPPAPST